MKPEKRGMACSEYFTRRRENVDISRFKTGFTNGVEKVFTDQLAFDLPLTNEFAGMGGPWPTSHRWRRQSLFITVNGPRQGNYHFHLARPYLDGLQLATSRSHVGVRFHGGTHWKPRPIENLHENRNVAFSQRIPQRADS